jgi:hypothetical protein
LKRAVLSDPYLFEDILAALVSTKIEEVNVSVEMDQINIFDIVEVEGGTALLNIVVNDCIQRWILVTSRIL